MSNLNARIGRAVKNLSEMGCPTCRRMKPYHILSSPAQYTPDLARCPACGRKHPIKVTIIEDATPDLGGGAVVVH